MLDDRQIWDLIVIGAGPAGALAARESARAGLSTLLVDRARFPRRKVCGGCLNARALGALADVGLVDLPRKLGARPIAALRIAAGGREARLPIPGGVAVSRAALDAALTAAAVEAGVVFRSGVEARLGPASGVSRAVYLHSDGTDRGTAFARVVIAADGLGGSAAGDGERIGAGSRIGAGAAYSDAPAFYGNGAIHMACGPGGYVGLVRVENGLLNVAAALDPSFVRESGGPEAAAGRILASAGRPALSADAVAPWKGTPFLTRRRRRVAGERLLVVGDSAGYVEPFTGEGMAWAMIGGMAAAATAVEAARVWRPSIAREWTRAHRRLLRRHRFLCGAIAALARRPELAVRTAGWTASRPALARAIATEFWGCA